MIDPSHPPKIWGYTLSPETTPETTPEALAGSKRFAVPSSPKIMLSGYCEDDHRLGLVRVEFPASRLRVVSVAYWTWDQKQHSYRTVCYDRLAHTRAETREDDKHFSDRMGHEFVQRLHAVRNPASLHRDRLDMLVFP